MKTKCASQTAQKFSKNLMLLIVSAVALCALPATALADSCSGQTNSRVTSGDWFNGMNWSAGVPNSTKSAQINNGGTATIGSTGAVSCDLTVGGSATQSGTLVVNHGSLNSTFDDAVGGYGKGTLTITNGGTVTAAFAGVAESAGSSGAVTVDGTNSQWTLSGQLDLGGGSNASGGTGLMRITAGGAVSAVSAHVWTSGTLTGNGTVGTTSGTTLEGTLKPNRTLFASGSTMQCNVTESSWDRAEVSGRATLGGRLSVTITGTFTTPADFPLLHASTLVGTFSSFSATYTRCLAPSIVYDYNNGYVYLHVESTCE
jgi:autotransporter family porin